MKKASLSVLAAVLAIAAGSAQAQTISIGTSPVGSSNYALGNALGKVMTEQLGLKVRVVPFGGGQQILPLINSKQLEMAIPSSTDSYFAYNGNGGPFKQPNKDLRVIATVFPYYLSWYVKKNSPYKSLADLKGKKIAIGFTANSAQHTSYLAGLAAFGVKASDFEGVPVPHVVRGADDFMQGKVEASTFAIGAGKMAEVDAKVGGIRWLSMPKDAAAEKRVKAIMPATFIDTLEAGQAPGRHRRPHQRDGPRLSGHGRRANVRRHRLQDRQAALRAAGEAGSDFEDLRALQETESRARPRRSLPPRRHQVLQGSRHLEAIGARLASRAGERS